VLAELSLTTEQTALVRKALDRMILNRSGTGPTAILTNPINVGVGTK
jgi:hypothetical protein